MAEAPPGVSDTESAPGVPNTAPPEEAAGFLPEEVRAFAGGALEGIPIIGPFLLDLGERIQAAAKDRPLTDIEQETLQLFEANPTATTAGNVAGAVLGTAPLGATGAFSTIPRALATGTALSAADVAARGGDVEDVALGGALGGVAGAGGVLLGRGLTQVGRGIVSAIRVPRSKLAGVIADASDDLVSQAKTLYQQADAVGVKLHSKTFNAMINKITKAATPKGDLAEEILAKNTPKATAALKWLKGLRDRTPTLSELDQIRQFIGDVAKSTDAGERRLGVLMVNALDDALGNLKNANFVQAELKPGISALEAARGLWRRGKILETVAGAAERAELANQPLGQAIQREVRTLMRRQRFVRTLASDEKKMLQDVARADVDTVLSIVGQYRTALGSLPTGTGIGGAALLAGVDPITAGAIGGAAVGVQTVASTAARGIKSVLARQRLLDATEALRTGVTLPKTLPGARAPAVGAVGVTIGANQPRERTEPGEAEPVEEHDDRHIPAMR